MRILFLHPNFPAQFRHLATALAKSAEHEVVFGTACQPGEIQGVRKVYYSSPPAPTTVHPYLRSVTRATLTGEAVYQMGLQLKQQGFIPDLILGHSGWGPTLFMKDIFPDAEFIGYFEWFYRAHGSDMNFDPSDTQTLEQQAGLRLKNTPFLIDLYSCDRGLTPTHWQHQQLPPEFQSKVSVLHDGIDTDFFCPDPTIQLVLPSIELDLSSVDEIVTYATRGMEPYRGFPQFMEAAAQLQRDRPHCHIVVMGDDRVAYGRQRNDGKTYREAMLERFDFDRSRLHFTGSLPYSLYRQVLQASSAHVYLTYPFVLSWSLLEAMATGCAIVGSDTPPVQEVITDGMNGLLVDFFSPADIAARVTEILDHPTRRQDARTHARQTVLEHYNLKTLLPQTIAWLLGRSPSDAPPSLSLHHSGPSTSEFSSPPPSQSEPTPQPSNPCASNQQSSTQWEWF